MISLQFRIILFPSKLCTTEKRTYVNKLKFQSSKAKCSYDVHKFKYSRQKKCLISLCFASK